MLICSLRKHIRGKGGLESVGRNGQGKTVISGKMSGGAGRLPR